MLPAPPKSSETRAIMLLILRDSEHLQVWPNLVLLSGLPSPWQNWECRTRVAAHVLDNSAAKACQFATGCVVERSPNIE
jgi:hypothetical protein